MSDSESTVDALQMDVSEVEEEVLVLKALTRGLVATLAERGLVRRVTLLTRSIRELDELLEGRERPLTIEVGSGEHLQAGGGDSR